MSVTHPFCPSLLIFYQVGSKLGETIPSMKCGSLISDSLLVRVWGVYAHSDELHLLIKPNGRNPDWEP